MTRLCWTLVGVITVLRLAAGFAVPLTGDEAYYWEWSRHLAAGYVDHPPAVAWTIAAFAGFGASPGVIRVGFWLCGVFAIAATADAARRIATRANGDGARAASIAALLVSSAPIGMVALGTASPDGPFLAAWAAVLDALIFLGERVSIARAALTGLALGAALLSRAFGVALALAVVVQLRRSPARVLTALLVALVCMIPFLAWNAAHDWATIVFTFVGRHVDEGFTLLRPLTTAAELLLALGPLGAFAAVATALRLRELPTVIAWTFWPLTLLLAVVSLMERVEVYWFLGPFLSLSCGAGVLFASARAPLGRRFVVATAAPTAFLLALMFTLLFAPFAVARTLASTLHVRLHQTGPFEIYTSQPLARDVRALAESRHAIVMTDGYGFSALLDHDGGLAPPILFGYSWQGREEWYWYDDAPPGTTALFVDKVAPETRPDIVARLHLACGRVVPGPTLLYPVPGVPPRPYWTTWCERMRPHAIAILRWERER